MLILSQFVLRLSFGLAAAMALTSPRRVTSGYFRTHAYVLLGLNVLAILAALADREQLLLWPPILSAVLSYLCCAVWLYEKPRLGRALLWSVACLTLAAAWLDQTGISASPSETVSATDFWHCVVSCLDPVTAGLLAGSTLAAMFLGHWYLNTPTMELAPLKKLIRLMAIGTAARAAVCISSFALLHQHKIDLSTAQWAMLSLRWAAGIIGVAVLAWMTWQTLKIPNTQSATGILYVAVVGTFLGELASLLLSAGTGYPL